MSKNMRPPPFVTESGTPTPKGLMPDARKRGPAPPKDANPKDQKRGRIDLPKDQSSKDPNSKGPNQTVLPPPPSTPVGQTITRLVHQNISEVDIAAWAKDSLEENNAAVTKGMCELFIRQVSHHKEIKAAAQAKEKAERDAVLWKYKCEQELKEKAKLLESHRKEIQAQTDKTHDARKRVAELEASQLELENSLAAAALKEKDLLARIATMEASGSLPAEERAQMEEEQRAQGQIMFMKSFMRKLPEFDWGQLGEATKDYAAGLAVEMEEEDRAKAEALAKLVNEKENQPA